MDTYMYVHARARQHLAPTFTLCDALTLVTRLNDDRHAGAPLLACMSGPAPAMRMRVGYGDTMHPALVLVRVHMVLVLVLVVPMGVVCAGHPP